MNFIVNLITTINLNNSPHHISICHSVKNKLPIRAFFPALSYIFVFLRVYEARVYEALIYYIILIFNQLQIFIKLII